MLLLDMSRTEEVKSTIGSKELSNVSGLILSLHKE